MGKNYMKAILGILNLKKDVRVILFFDIQGEIWIKITELSW